MFLIIMGEPASKANSREVGTIGAKKYDVITGKDESGAPIIERMRVGGRIMNRKSDKALKYEADALKQIPWNKRLRIEGPVRVTMNIYYASRRPDLDESVILDVLQDRYRKVDGELRMLVQHGVYRNDSQVEEKHIYRFIDRKNPRAEIEVETLVMQAQPLDLPRHETTISADEVLAMSDLPEKPF